MQIILRFKAKGPGRGWWGPEHGGTHVARKPQENKKASGPISDTEAVSVAKRYLSGEGELVSSETLSSNVYRVGDYAVKEPKSGFAFRWIEYGHAQEIVSEQYDFLPPIRFVQTPKGPILVQRWIDVDSTRTPSESSIKNLSNQLKAGGITPRDMRAGNVVYDKSGKLWVIDTGEFDYPIKTVMRGWNMPTLEVTE